MKTTTKILFLLAMPLLASVGIGQTATTTPETQNGEHPRSQEMRERRMKQLEEKLNLTPEQKTKITAIWDKAEQDGRAAREAAAADAKQERRAKRRETMKAVREEVRGVLTPEQQQTFDRLAQERRAGGLRRNHTDK